MSRLARTLSLAALFACASAAPAAVGPLDLIPNDAACSLSIRSQSELKKKGDKFLDDKEIADHFRNLFGFFGRPSELFDQAYDFLGVKTSVDVDGAAAIFLANPEALDIKIDGGLEILRAIVAVVPFKDRDEIGADFGLKKGELKVGEVVELKRSKNGFFRFGYVRGPHLYLGMEKKVLENVAKVKTLADELTAGRRKALESADILLHGSPFPWRDDWKQSVQTWEKGLNLADDKEKEAAHQLALAVEELRYAFLAFRVEGDGLGMHAATVFSKEGDKAAARFLTALRGGPGAADLKGLPAGKALAAYAFRSNGAESAVVARILFNEFLRDLGPLTPFLSPADRPLLVGVFTEMWKRVKAQRLALYVNADPDRHGLFSVALVLDVDDPKKLLDEVKDLARFAVGKDLDLSDAKGADAALLERLVKDLADDSYQVRETAQTKLALIGEPARPFLEKAIRSDDAEQRRRAEELLDAIKTRAELVRKEALDKNLPHRIRPGFVLHPKAETLDGQSVDVVEVKLGKEDASAVAGLKQFFGPDWSKIRVATVGKQVAVLVGSDVGLLKAAVKNVKDGAAGLADDKALAAFAKNAGAEHKAELHLAVSALGPLLTSGDVGNVKAASLVSYGLIVEADRLELDVWLPREEIKAMIKQGK
jgi:hypothetical protein